MTAEMVDVDSIPDPADHEMPEWLTGRTVAVRTPSELVPVQRPATVTPYRHPADLIPVVPEWMHSREGWAVALSWHARLASHKTQFHTYRLPKYAARVALRAPLGVWRLLVEWSRWVTDAIGLAMEQEVANGSRADVKAYIALRRDRRTRVKQRGTVSVLAAVALTVAGWWTDQNAPEPVRASLIALALIVLAKVGSADNRVLEPAMMTTPGGAVITDAVVMRALKHAKLGGTPAKFDRDGFEIEAANLPSLAAPIRRDGRGVLVITDLPRGKTVKDAAGAHQAIASGMDIDAVQLFIESIPGMERRVGMWVSDDDPFMREPRRSPLAALPVTSIWAGHPLGVEPRGREVPITLIDNAVLAGGVPQMGKTSSCQVIAAPAILDPYCDLSVIDLKGGRNWSRTGDITVAYVAGSDHADQVAAVEVLRNVKRDAQARYARFKELTDEECPEGKLTPALAKAGMRPHVVIVDEVQNLLRSEFPEIRLEATQLLVWLVKLGPAAGYIVVLATQRPSAEVIPTDIRGNVSIRLALRTKDPDGTRAILGESATTIGFRPHDFREEHKGAAVLGGVSNGRGGDISVIRVDLIEIEDFAAICNEGRARREAAGTLPGGSATASASWSVIDDVLSVWPGDEAKVQARTLVASLRATFPTRHDGLDEAKLTRALKRHDVPARQVYRDGTNRNGYALDTIRAALDRATGGA